MPSLMEDLKLYQAATAADSWLVVKAVRGRDLYGRPYGPRTETSTTYINPGRRDVEILPAFGGTPIRRRIMAWVPVADGVDQIQLDSALGVALTTETTIVSWLSEQRLASDQIELRWLTDNVVETSLPMRSL